MMGIRVFLVIVLATFAKASPALSKSANLDVNFEEMRSLCAEHDPIACLKLKAISFLDSLFRKKSYQVVIDDNVEVTRNSYSLNDVTSRGEDSIEDHIEDYLKTHDATFKLPIFDTKIELGARNLDNGELDLKVNFASPIEARKSKLKKIVLPILVFVLLKAITLVPLALGVLGLKAWNAVQLSFFSFIVAVGLAVFQLCKKIAADGAPPQIAAHPPWEPAYAHYAARAFEDKDAQKLAYAAYAQN